MKNLRNSPKKKKIREVFYTLFYNDKERKTSIVLFACMFVCLPVRLYPINVKTPRKVYGDRIFKICLINILFLKILKIHEIFCENPRIIFVLFYDVHIENMFTINLEDGREAPFKASIDIIAYHRRLH